VQRAYILADDAVDLDFGGIAGDGADATSLRVAVGTPLAEIERQAIYATLDHCGGQKKRCAEILGISLKTLYNRLAAYQDAPRDVSAAR
jgi:two-component system, NtrC family, response regulator AtoC